MQCAPRCSIVTSVAHLIMITPAASGGSGNAVTAQRWATRLRELGHRVQIRTRYSGEPCDVLVALHARKSARAVRQFRRRHPRGSLVVVLTGTDVYRDLRRNAAARGSLALADRIVALQPLAAREIPASLRRRVVVIRQSALALAAVKPPRAHRSASPRRQRAVAALVLAHLRDVKDPLRAAYAACLLPPESRVAVVHAGRAYSEAWAMRARREMARNPRYRWLGEISHARARRLLAGADMLVVASRLEGGANVVSEAIAAGTPVLASRIPGNVGLLGPGYAGYFPVGDAGALAALMRRVETDRGFAARLRRSLRDMAPMFRPARERSAWKALLHDLLD